MSDLGKFMQTFMDEDTAKWSFKTDDDEQKQYPEEFMK